MPPDKGAATVLLTRENRHPVGQVPTQALTSINPTTTEAKAIVMSVLRTVKSPSFQALLLPTRT